MDEKALREKVAGTLARYATDAFSNVGAKCLPSMAEWPSSFSENETDCFRSLAARVLDDVREHLRQTEHKVRART